MLAASSCKEGISVNIHLTIHVFRQRVWENINCQWSKVVIVVNFIRDPMTTGLEHLFSLNRAATRSRGQSTVMAVSGAAGQDWRFGY